jgi:hypothetical protein
MPTSVRQVAAARLGCFIINPGGDVEGMTDLTGMAYTALPNAQVSENSGR